MHEVKYNKTEVFYCILISVFCWLKYGAHFRSYCNLNTIETHKQQAANPLISTLLRYNVQNLVICNSNV